MNRVNIILDTNVFLVSLAPRYKYHWIFQALISGKYNLSVSNEILMEYEEQIVIRYGLDKTEATLNFLLLLPNVRLITPYYHWQLIENDPDDNKFVDCAVAANTDFIVSNDKDFQIVKKSDFPTIKVLTYCEFEEEYKDKFI